MATVEDLIIVYVDDELVPLSSLTEDLKAEVRHEVSFRLIHSYGTSKGYKFIREIHKGKE